MKIKIPRPDQIEAIAAILKELAVADRCKAILACGTGKTLISLWVSQRLQAKNVLVAIPKLLLQSQSLSSWIEDIRGDFDFDVLLIGSDKTVGEAYSVKNTTDSHEIRQFLLKDKKKIVFTTYQSVEALSVACKAIDFEFDFLIGDEAHRTAGKEKKHFSKLLFDEFVVCKKRLFMTATEKLIDGDKVISMSDESLYGKTAYFLSTSKAIEMGILSEYKVLVMYLESLPDTEINLEQLSFDALRKAIEQYDMKRIISYHSSIKRAKKFRDTFIESDFDIKAFHFNHEDRIKARIESLKEIKTIAERVIITNAQALTEGFDLPEADCAAIIDPRSSASDIVQIVGRVLRKHPSKKMGYVFLPVLITKDNFIDEKSFSNVRKALSAMASADERIADYFKKRNDKKRYDKGRIIIESNISPEFSPISEKLHLRVWENIRTLYWRDKESVKSYFKEVLSPLGIDTAAEWRKFKRGEIKIEGITPPIDIPFALKPVYGENDADFFEKVEKMPYEEIRKFVISLIEKEEMGKNYTDWQKYYDENLSGRKDIRKELKEAYPEYTSWKDFIESKMPFFEIREIVRSFVKENGIKIQKEWVKKVKRKNLPKSLNSIKIETLKYNVPKIYKDEWKGWDDFLGFEKVDKFVSYNEAKEWLKPLNLKSSGEYEKWRANKIPHLPKCPDFIPSNPKNIYKDEWAEWGDFLGFDNSFLSYKEAKEWLKPLKIKGSGYFQKWLIDKEHNLPQRPKFIPSDPKTIYKDEWKGWDDFLSKKIR